MNGVIRTMCPECGTKQRVEVNFPSEKAGFESTVINCSKCEVELSVTDQHEYDDNGLVTSPRVVDEHSTDMCAACDIDLGTCDTLWAAGGALYCSRECGIHDYSMMSNISAKDAEQLFDEEAEEINPTDIGIVRRCDHEA